ncbi:MAG: hypothetical protein ACD_32C00009G0003 [uncultured bacterium]|nr:MAG: hypothetical protein ACD_32C00009G0003 [uncultured bacterium]
MSKVYYLNPKSVLFHPVFDLFNHYNILVYDPEEDILIKVNKVGYAILKFIDDEKEANIDLIQSEVWKRYPKVINNLDKKALIDFIHLMQYNNVVFEKETHL